MNEFLDYVSQYAFTDIRVIFVLVVIATIVLGYILFFYKEEEKNDSGS